MMCGASASAAPGRQTRSSATAVPSMSAPSDAGAARPSRRGRLLALTAGGEVATDNC